MRAFLMDTQHESAKGHANSIRDAPASASDKKEDKPVSAAKPASSHRAGTCEVVGPRMDARQRGEATGWGTNQEGGRVGTRTTTHCEGSAQSTLPASNPLEKPVVPIGSPGYKCYSVRGDGQARLKGINETVPTARETVPYCRLSPRYK